MKPFVNLHMDCYGKSLAGDSRHGQAVIRELGITYEECRGSSVADCWLFWNCDNVPDDLPEWLKIMEGTTMDDAPWWLTIERATELTESANARLNMIKGEEIMKYAPPTPFMQEPGKEKDSALFVVEDGFSNSGLLTSLRYKLIKLLAGKAVVIINADLRYIKRDSEDVDVQANGCKGLYCENTKFYRYGEMILSIGQRKKS